MFMFKAQQADPKTGNKAYKIELEKILPPVLKNIKLVAPIKPTKTPITALKFVF